MQSGFIISEHTEQETFFADVILPLPLPLLFTYRVPKDLNQLIRPGLRAVVQFGQKRILTAIVAKVHHNPPQVYEAKYILELLDDSPTVNKQQFQLFEWISEYYMCTQGEVMNAAIPSGLKLSSESKIQLNPDYEEGSYEFSAQESMILEELEKRSNLSYSDVMSLLNKKAVHLVIKSLITKRAVLIFEELKDKYSPKVIRKIRLSDAVMTDKKSFEETFRLLEKKEKQLQILLRYLQMLPVQQNRELNKQGLAKNIILNQDISSSALNTLIKNNIFEEFDVVVSRFADEPDLFPKNIELSEDQNKAKEQILFQMKEKEVILLHGITGSGKTEVYVELIKQALDGGSQVLMLVPEIALTTQIVSRLHKVFGNKMGVYHSRYSDNERVEVWKGVISGKFSFIVGVRSSVFLPFDNLGLVIIDEEHESSYKQYDPAPRYHARDTAIVLAKLHNAKTILGSATPSVESYYNAVNGKWGLVTMEKRYGEAVLPEMILIDTAREKKNKTMKIDFSQALLSELKLCIDDHKQAILFQNRRGYAPLLNCEDCGYIPKCSQCSVSLTYHMYSAELRCHYCGHVEKVPSYCPACGSTKIKTVGFGTEKLEDDLKLLLPEARVQRMDLDTTRKKNSYQEIINAFEAGKTNVLVGTQMVTKGLDFEDVILVGIFDIDRMIHFPDFRASERVFQVLTQVSGRAGRRGTKGRVLIQTSNPGQAILRKVIESDYQGLYNNEISERERFKYPPFVRMIRLTIKDPEKNIAHQVAAMLANTLIEQLGKNRVLGPEAPVIDKIRNNFLVDIFIKLEREKINIPAVKAVIRKEIDKVLKSDKNFRSSILTVDVDPA